MDQTARIIFVNGCWLYSFMYTWVIVSTFALNLAYDWYGWCAARSGSLRRLLCHQVVINLSGRLWRIGAACSILNGRTISCLLITHEIYIRRAKSEIIFLVMLLFHSLKSRTLQYQRIFIYYA